MEEFFSRPVWELGFIGGGGNIHFAFKVGFDFRGFNCWDGGKTFLMIGHWVVDNLEFASQ